MTEKEKRIRDKRIKNLKPFKPGQSGNPQGRPPKPKCIPDILRTIGNENIKDSTKLESVLRKVYDLALKGKPWAVEFIAERTEGKPIQPLQIDANIQQRINIEQKLKELSSKTPDEIIDEINRLLNQ